MAYPQKMRQKRLQKQSKLEQLEKVKLLETLDLNEEIAIKFFARRNESRKEIENLEKKSDDLLLELENTLSLDDKKMETKQKQIISDLFKTRESIEASRNNFINSLTDILTISQISKLIVFERKFRDEIRNVLLNKRRQ
jgi:hypothetical protein